MNRVRAGAPLQADIHRYIYDGGTREEAEKGREEEESAREGEIERGRMSERVAGGDAHGEKRARV